VEGAIEVPLFPYALFRLHGSVLLQAPAFICSRCPSARTRQKGRNFMKIKIRYENEYQTLEVENVELERWLNISISEDESQEDYEKRIQDVIEERFNRPDYNSWHKHDRHTGNAYMKSKDGTVEVNTEEAIMCRAADKSAFNSSIDGVHNQLEYEECCETLRSLLKPAVADMVIAIALDGYTVGEYAASIGDDSNNVSHRYRRAIRKLKKFFQKRPFNPSTKATR
jgi:hypothetical protein